MRAPMVVWLLSGLLVLLGAGGIYGGVAMLLDPSGHLLQMHEVLPKLLVPDYTLPGLFLLVVMGVAPLVLSFALLRQPHWSLPGMLPRLGRQYWAWSATLALGIILALWLALQGALIGFRWPVQFAVAVNAALLLLITLLPGVRRFYHAPRRRHGHRTHSGRAEAAR